MSSNNPKNYLVSTISDNPRDLFENLSLFNSHDFGGLHFDVMDGVFVPRLGLYPELLQEIRKSTSLFIEVHAMLNDPLPYLNLLAESGANRIVVHVETPANLDLILREINSLGIESLQIVSLPEITAPINLSYTFILMILVNKIPHPRLEVTLTL